MTILFLAIQSLVVVHLCYFAYLLCFVAMRSYKYDWWLTGLKYTSGIMILTISYELVQIAVSLTDLSYWWFTEDEFHENLDEFLNEKNGKHFDQSMNLALIIFLAVLHIVHVLIDYKISRPAQPDQQHGGDLDENPVALAIQLNKQNLKILIKTLRAMAALTIVCCLPNYIYIFFQGNIKTQMEYVTLLILFSRSAFNPLICLNILGIPGIKNTN